MNLITSFYIVVFGAGSGNTIVDALTGANGGVALLPIAKACLMGAISLRCLSEGYNWIIHGDAGYLRNLIVTAAGGMTLSLAAQIVGLITGVSIPSVF